MPVTKDFAYIGASVALFRLASLVWENRYPAWVAMLVFAFNCSTRILSADTIGSKRTLILRESRFDWEILKTTKKRLDKILGIVINYWRHHNISE